MRLLIIRHGDPDYAHNALTDRGHIEAAALARYLMTQRIDDCYQSPYGRAQQTAEYYLKASGKTAETLDWLREFPARIRYKEAPELEPYVAIPQTAKNSDLSLVINTKPAYWCGCEEYFGQTSWKASLIAEHSDIELCHKTVTDGLDTLLQRYGYVHDGHLYRATRANHTTVALFCHFAVESVMLSHLLNLPMYVLLQCLCAQPSSVTELVTEERDEGLAFFRMLRYGDIGHLSAEGIEPSFGGRFCECFTDDARH